MTNKHNIIIHETILNDEQYKGLIEQRIDQIHRDMNKYLNDTS